ncbi:MAG: four helix bundle protein [Saprospiraceae bacterium]|jgi:four helix bundle protein|nr:four helix bundle protein [Saprospiraceae bacterium]MBK7796100.1 four helix bundle protein [Saprospiraceae bacterium]MBL0261184.1 four helix bundle protein [Saprospiraceae bacterium]MBX7164254.1 four helix bundle protein [Saprospiraceae bacterium]
MRITRFEDIVAWQKAQDVAVDIYTVFGSMKDFGFRDQICRATVSISNNIAEGFNRSSDADFIRYLYISLGSCNEVISMLYLAHRLKYIDETQKETLLNKSTEIAKIIRGLIKSFNKL